ncbi:MAG: hypothetical protein K8E66_10095 [Phycisphaerales bacterium]|nr:hypothetical protein [Phycisphaerales bacterium]
MTRGLVIVTMLLAAHSHAQQTIPTTRVRDCTTDGCHAPVLDHEVLHGPTGISECGACHEYTDPARHAFVFKRKGADLCTFCHLGAGTQLGMVGHKPFDDGDCTGCHDPHGSRDSNLLRADTQTELCALCHEDAVVGLHVHTPAADGDCLGCHGAHGAEHKGLLNRTGSALCFTCHEDTRELVTKSVMVHEPAADNCLECHAPHASDTPAHLLMEPLALCESCHPEPAETARHATVKHSAVLEGRACLNCHQPHASNHEGVLHADPVASCLACHAEPLTTEHGVVVKGVPEIAVEGAVLHGPVRKELCTGCHELHGSDHPVLLAANYTQKFYEPFKLALYDLCFKCHAKEMVLNQESTAVTNFRNGSQNLHFAHVNREKQGRACRSCHATHASASDLHVPDSVPYGDWKLPLNFMRTESGGACNSGCHRPATYDRVNATIGIELPDEPGGN